VALRRRAEFELKILESRVPGAGEKVTLAEAAQHYLALKQPSPFVTARIKKLVKAVGGGKDVGKIRSADLVAAANFLYPLAKNETKNRWAIKPGAAILHYAAENEWCGWVRVRKLEEAPPVTRAAAPGTDETLLAALTADEPGTALKRLKRRRAALLILWLFKHGNRISDPLRLTWPAIDLHRKVYTMLVGKARRIVEKPLDEEVWEALANDETKEGFGKEDYVFPWRTRSGVYKWLRPLVRELGMTFTPHRARHALGKRLNAEANGLKTIMAALDHSDAKSSLRYQDADVEVVRQALAGKSPGKARKTA
jgi:integrase